MSFREDLKDYILSGHALLAVNTYEKDRAISSIQEVCKTPEVNKELLIWSVALGWVTANGEPLHLDQEPEDALKRIIELDADTIFVLKDFSIYTEKDVYARFDHVISWLDILRQTLWANNSNIIIVDPNFQIPNSLKYDVVSMDFALPDKDAILDLIKYSTEEISDSDGNKIKLANDNLDGITSVCSGMSSQQIQDSLAFSIRRNGQSIKTSKRLDRNTSNTLLKEKVNMLKSNGLLQYIEPPNGGMSNVGGLEILKKHIMLDKLCLTEKARENGVEFPKGILCCGVPGSGKTLIALSIASEFQLPLISLDIGCLTSKYVGESESNLREAIKVIESISPVVLLIDEIEKMFGGDQIDGGVSSRMLGGLLKFLSSRISPVYVVGTANNLFALPVELTRKGRFDECVGFLLPNENERANIFKIHLNKRSCETDGFDLQKLSEQSSGFTGSDIEQAVILGIKIAFSLDKKLDMDILEDAIKNIMPLSKTNPEKIKEIEQWIKTNTRLANEQSGSKTRKVKI